MRDLANLLQRVECAAGYDRGLDVVLWRELAGGGGDHAAGREPLPWLHNYTSSIDDALALVERIYPGEGVVLETHGKNIAGIGQSGQYPARGATPALAIVASLLTAMIARSP